MHKSQLYFGVSVGLLVLFIGWTLTLAGIGASALILVGLLILLANVGYWFASRGQRRVRVIASRQGLLSDYSQKGKR